MATATMADELTCPVCLEFYKDPRVLPCQHSFCKSCLVALISNKEKDSNCEIQCPCCRYVFHAENETYIDALPKNFTLASIVCKFQSSFKGDIFVACDLCDEDQKGRAIKKCLHCQLYYCKMCMEQLHPKRGALANHVLVPIVEALKEKQEHGEPKSDFSSRVSERSSSTLECGHLIQEKYCLSCNIIFTNVNQTTAVGSHENHDTTGIQTAFRRKKVIYIPDILITMKKIAAKHLIEEEMKIRINSLEKRLRKMEDHKRKTQMKITSLKELSSLTNEDAIVFFMKIKELQKEIESVTEDNIQQNIKEPGCDLSLPIEQVMNDVISDATRVIWTSNKRPHATASTLADTDISPQQASLAIKVTNVQKKGKMCADVEWVAMDQVDHYEISYSCNPSESALKRNIMENRCALTSLRWDSEYTITVTAYMPDGKTSFDSRVFKTDPKVKDKSPTIPNVLPKHMDMAINVTNDQKEEIMSADVEWWPIQPTGQYVVSYHCNPEETVVLMTTSGARCRLTHLRWNSTYTIKVTAHLPCGTTVFDIRIFITDPQVKCYPMAVSNICIKKVSMSDSFNAFTASNRIKKWEDFHKVGDFSGIVFTPVLTEEKHFWTMNITLTLFEQDSTSEEFLDFGIVNYANIGNSTGLTGNRAAYSCSISTSRRGNFYLKFETPSGVEGRHYQLPLALYQKEHFCFGFMFDQVNRQFAVMDCLTRKVLHVFNEVTFKINQSPLFAVCPYHDVMKMHVKVKLDHMHCNQENVSYWIRQINAF
ncbi:hypothetical protein ACJMK2_039036 [Sinanodonta woodiana]|uniref:RING-type domain-containing protein n=1 Tax=Sinanodonta woodiana TaxID=1069815 RepID=A0ABD3WE58_SINWO